MFTSAIISLCENYRHSLSRVWDDSKPKVLFIMLNPSTANAEEDNPTIRRCIGFAKDWGYGGLYVGNLFDYRTTNPKKIKEAYNPESKYNRQYLKDMAKECDLIVCAWGNKKGKPPEWMFEELGELHYIDLAKDGTPKHPFYLKKELKPKKFEYGT